MLGALTGGKTWQILRLMLKDNALVVQRYYRLSSTEDKEIVGSIPAQF